FGLHYAFSENFVLPLSHDEVVHGKRSILGRMPGDAWQRFANLRAYYGFMFGHPGKKLMFMGCEFAQDTEWNHEQSLPWHLLDQPAHAGIHRLVTGDANHSVFAWLRKGSDPNACCVVAVNFTPEVRRDYRIRVPFAGRWREVLNTDAAIYGGSNTGNAGAVSAVVTSDSPELRLVLPPLAAVYLVPEN